MGMRSKRFALIANDGVVEYIGVDEKAWTRAALTPYSANSESD